MCRYYNIYFNFKKWSIKFCFLFIRVDIKYIEIFKLFLILYLQYNKKKFDSVAIKKKCINDSYNIINKIIKNEKYQICVTYFDIEKGRKYISNKIYAITFFY